MLLSIPQNDSHKIYSFLNNKRLVLWGILLIIPVFAVFYFMGIDHKSIALAIGIPIAFLAAFSFDVSIALFIIILFINLDLLGLKVSVLFIIPMILCYLVTTKRIQKDLFTHPLAMPVVFYIITMIPSFLNTTSFWLSFYSMFNLFFMVILFSILSVKIQSYDQIKKTGIFFLSLCLINGLYLIFLGATSDGRVFGFPGVVFVDYVALALLITVIYLFFIKSPNKLFLYPLTIVFLVALLFTRTRSTLIIFAVVFLIFVLFLLKKNKHFSFDKKKIFSAIIFIIFLVLGVVVVILKTMPEVVSRFNQLTHTSLQVQHEVDIGLNSLLTRMLIWFTAVNAFLKHPWIGIGAFSFPFSSKIYNTLPDFLFKTFVEGLSPHITYLAVLTETGIIGFVGFTVFLITSLRLGYKSIKSAITEEQKTISVIIFFLQVYIALAMCISDAWLWGQCGMLWGIVLGLSIANYKIIQKQNPYSS